MVALAVAELVTRRLTGGSVPGAGPLVQHLVLWVGFLGAAVAARDGRLLALATGDLPARALARALRGWSRLRSAPRWRRCSRAPAGT